jgi:hypothetical protein
MPKSRKEVGYEVCRHICPGRNCISIQTQTILWKKEGSSCQRHCASATKHPNCIASGICPLSICIGRKGAENSMGVRTATEEELALLPSTASNTPDPTSDVEMEDTPMSTITQSVRNDPVFHIIFVLDPTTRITSKAAATNDLAFVNVTVSQDEYDSVSHLDGYIHNIKAHKTRYFVCMQEWVCIF